MLTPEERERLVLDHDGLARHLARRFRGRGEPVEDLEQVARLGLVNAADRFDPGRGVQFSTFAARTVLGELKRHLRDKAWALRVPRSLQDRWLEVSRAVEELTHRIGRPPTIGELAKETGLLSEDVLEALDSGSAYRASSLDEPLSDDAGSSSTGEMLGVVDPNLDSAERWADLSVLLEALSNRERRIIYLRFFEGKTQTEIGDEMGISQMHVSRLLRRSLARMREKDADNI